MMKVLLLFNTIKYLKPIQVYYRLFYFTRNRFRKLTGFRYKLSKKSNSNSFKLIDSFFYYSKVKDKTFYILNRSKTFDDIDWNFSEFGKLWTYNLTYFEYLDKKEDVWLIYDFIEKIDTIKDGLEPFPISLRGINWIKFLTKYDIKDKKIDDSLYAQYYILLDNLEYHLLGNHLLENGFSLLFGAYYFEDDILYHKAINILKQELKEQILEDSAHFELSPMYHQLMLFRILDCISLIQNNTWKDKSIVDFLQNKASFMLGWLKEIIYKNGEIPLLNDSATHIAPTSNEIFEYANHLNIVTKKIKLSASGYRKIIKEKYECIVDIGKIGADYIPGHAHADTFNFEVYTNNKPFIIDTGISTYEVGKIRDIERSTKAHNTVEINNTNSSEVWGGFRVANRAYVISLEEKENYIKATHNGYKSKYGILHTRKWTFKDDKIIIEDSLNKEADAVFRLHFHPDISENFIKKHIKTNSLFSILYSQFSSEFNKRVESLCLEIEFDKELKVEILIN